MTEGESIEGIINWEERFPCSKRIEVTDVQRCRGIVGRGGEKGRRGVDGTSEFPSKLDRKSDLSMEGPVESTVRLDQYNWEDFSEFYLPLNPHLTPGVAKKQSQASLCCSINPTLHFPQWVHRSKLMEEKCFNYNLQIDKYWKFLLQNDDPLVTKNDTMNFYYQR